MTHATAWMDLRDIRPSEISQTQRSTCFHFWEVPRVTKFIERENGEGRGLGEVGMGTSCLVGTQVQFCKMTSILEMDGGDGCTTI